MAASGDTDHQESLAAFAGMLQGAVARAKDLLPLGEPQVVEVSGENGVGLRSRIFSWEDEQFTLTQLGRRAAAPDAHVEAVVSLVPLIIAANR